MYLVSGVATNYSDGSGLQNPVLDISACPSGRIFATVTLNSLSVWSIQPTCLISQVYRSEATISQDGGNRKIVWKPDGTCLAVYTDKGFLHFYTVSDTKTRAFQYDLNGASHYHLPCANERKPLTVTNLNFNISLEVDAGISTVSGTNDCLLVYTMSAPASVVSMKWTGEIYANDTISFENLGFIKDSSDFIVETVVFPSEKDYLWITNNGLCYYVQKTNEDTDWDGFFFYEPDSLVKKAKCAAINMKMDQIAIARHDGSVLLYSIDKQTFKLQNTLKLDHVACPITCIQFTCDGMCFAVSFESTPGLVLWSKSGKLIMNTTNEEQDFLPSPFSNNEPISDPYFHGSRSLFWGPENYQLFILACDHLQSNTDFFVLEFFKSSHLTVLDDSSTDLMLLGSTSLMIYPNELCSLSSDPNVKDTIWECIDYPAAYISSNWPIKLGSVGESNFHLAIAGTRGFCHYNTASGKWKLFGNEQQEQSFTVQSFLWYRNILLVGCMFGNEPKLLFFNRDNNLDLNNMVHSIDLNASVVCLNRSLNRILIYTSNSMIYFYTITLNGSDSLSLSPLSVQLSLDLILKDPSRIRCISFFSQSPFQLQDRVPDLLILDKSCLFLLKNHDSDQFDEFVISENVDLFWNCTNEFNILAVQSNELAIWSNLLVPFDNEDWLKHALNLKPAFYPLTVSQTSGLVIGVEQLITSGSLINFQVGVQTLLYVPHFILKMLLNSEMMRAVAFAELYKGMSYFDYILELCLHQALEADVFSPKESQVALPLVSMFLQSFPERIRLDVVVKCARKSEVSYWDYYFEVMGKPMDLFKASLRLELLETATSYLIILQATEPFDCCLSCAVDLLKTCFVLEKFEIALELVRFLSKFAHLTAVRKLSINTNDSFDPLTLEIITNYLDSLIDSKQLFRACTFCVQMSLDLSVYLEKHIGRLLADCREPGFLDLIHSDFGFKYPHELIKYCATEKELLESQIDPTVSSNWKRITSKDSAVKLASPLVPLFKAQALQLRFLLNALLSINLYPVAFVCAIVLMDVDCCRSILQMQHNEENSLVIELWKNNLKSSEYRGYKTLETCIKEITSLQ